MDKKDFKHAQHLQQSITSQKRILEDLNEIIEVGQINSIQVILPKSNRRAILGERDGNEFKPIPVDEPLLEFFKRFKEQKEYQIKELERQFDEL